MAPGASLNERATPQYNAANKPNGQPTFGSVRDVWNHQVATCPHQTIFSLPLNRPLSANGASAQFQDVSFKQADGLAAQIAAIYSRTVPPRLPGQPATVVAFVAANSLDIALQQIAMLKLGHTAAFLSPNNSTAALTHLLKATSAQLLVYGTESSALAHEAVDLLSSEGYTPPLALTELSTPSHFRPNGAATHPHPPASIEDGYIDGDDCVWILHSSGSTGFPKPIILSHKAMVSLITSKIVPNLFHTLPLFHQFGLISMWNCIFGGTRVFFVSRNLNAGDLVAKIRAANAKWFCGVPLLLKALAEHAEGPRALASFELVLVGGSACPTEMGDKLVEQGVKLVMQYGATEFGSVATSVRDFDREKDWEYMRILPHAVPFLEFEPISGGFKGDEAVMELLVRKSWPALADVPLQDGFYRSRDLFRRHPEKPNAYKHLGRRDDTLVHDNGEKTNPVPMEHAMRASPLVANCVVFGAGRSQAGALIIPSDAAVASVSTLRDEQTRQRALWRAMLPAVEAANHEAPSHSRIVPEMVRVLPHGTTFASADKGSLIRAKVMLAFSEVIDRAYDDYDHGQAPSLVEAGAKLETLQDVLSAVEGAVRPLVQLPADTEALDMDLVEMGMNSLSATRIRNSLQRIVTASKPLPSNVVFEQPTVRRLAAYILDVVKGLIDQGDEGRRYRTEQELEATERLVETFRVQIAARKADGKSAKQAALPTLGATVVLTGATGSLGAHTLHQLSQRPGVVRIVCLNRAASDEEARQRLDQSLAFRKLPPVEELERCADGGLSVRIESRAADLAKDRLGLASAVYDELLGAVNTVIHIAWPVNFNMTVDSFAPSIQGAVNLLNLATQSRAKQGPARYLFASSVSAAMGKGPGTISETISHDPRDAMPMGYARSKWAVERLCEIAGETVGGGFEAVVLRIGQMVGDTKHGIWNETEAVPLMLRTARTMGCLPDLRGRRVSWLGTDIAARMVALLATNPPAPGASGTYDAQGPDVGLGSRTDIVHVVNPVLTPYDDIFASLAKPENLGPTFELVPRAEWVKRLEQSANQDAGSNPTLKLKEHYKSMWGQEGRSDGDKSAKLVGDEDFDFETKRLQSILSDPQSAADTGSKVRGEAVAFDAVTHDHVSRMVAAWKQRGFL